MMYTTNQWDQIKVKRQYEMQLKLYYKWCVRTLNLHWIMSMETCLSNMHNNIFELSYRQCIDWDWAPSFSPLLLMMHDEECVKGARFILLNTFIGFTQQHQFDHTYSHSLPLSNTVYLLILSSKSIYFIMYRLQSYYKTN